MQIVIAGANGFVGQAVVEEAVRRPEFTTVIALSRRPLQLQAGTPGADKLKNVTIEDYELYPPEIKEQLAGTSACIWSVLPGLITHSGQIGGYRHCVALLYQSLTPGAIGRLESHRAT